MEKLRSKKVVGVNTGELFFFCLISIGLNDLAKIFLELEHLLSLG